MEYAVGTGSVTILSVADRAAWQDIYRQGGLPSQSWHYAHGLAAAGYDPRLALVRTAQARMILPFHVRNWGEHADIATLPGLSGALLEPDLGAPLDLWRDFARRQGWVSGYIQLSARNAALAVPPPDRAAAHNVLFEFDLANWDSARALSRNSRRSLMKAEGTGVRLITDPARLRPAFAALYAPAMRMFGAREIFPDAAIARWLDDPDLLIYGAETGGRIVAVDLGRRAGDQAEMHLAALTPEGRDLHGWLVWKLARDLQDKGLRYLNIGGYGVAGDGIDFMKRRFNTPVLPLRSVRQIYDADLYDRLCRAAGADPAIDADPAAGAGMIRFPPYRFAGGTKD